jgi:hypothetical protein
MLSVAIERVWLVVIHIREGIFLGFLGLCINEAGGYTINSEVSHVSNGRNYQFSDVGLLMSLSFGTRRSG